MPLPDAYDTHHASAAEISVIPVDNGRQSLAGLKTGWLNQPQLIDGNSRCSASMFHPYCNFPPRVFAMKSTFNRFLAVTGAIAASAMAQTTYTYSGSQAAMNQAQAPVATYDTVEWNITAGYFGTSGARSQTYANPNLIFTNVIMNNGWGEAVTRFSSATTVTGAGPFSLVTAGLGQDFVFAGNMQGYGGNVSIADFGNNTLTLGSTASSVVQYGGESSGGNKALGTITSDASGNWIDNVAGSGSISVNNVVFNYATDASYGYVKVTNAISQRDSVNFIGNANVLASGVIDGAGALNKSGGGTLTLTGANNYSGATSVTGGILNVGTGGTSGNLGSGAITVGSGAEIVFNRSNAFTVSNTISGAGLITKKGGGRMTINGNSSGGTVNWNFTGTGNGDIGFQNANAIGGTGSTITLAESATGSAFFNSGGNISNVGIILGSGSTLSWNGSFINTNTLSGVISGSGNFTKISGEHLILTGTNTYTGNTTISDGTLQIGGSGVLGNGNYAGTISNSSLLFVNSSSDQTLASAISGAGRLEKSNSGTLTLSTVNSYTGGTTVNGGILRLTASSGGTGTIRGTLTANAGTTIQIAGTDVLGYSTGSDAVRTLSLNGAHLVQTLNRNETVTAVINMAGGSSISATGGPSASFDLFGGGARVNASGNETNLISAAIRLRQSDTVFNVGDGAQAVDLLVSGGISRGAEGNGALIKNGNGTLSLAGTNTYNGATMVSAGTLLVTGSLGNTDVTVESTATIGGSGTLGGSLTFDPGAFLNLSGATLGLTSTDILSVSGSITLNDFGFGNLIGWDWANAVAGTYTLIDGGGTITLSGTTPTSSNPFDFGNGKSGYFQEGSLQAVIIPEPRAALLGGLGMLLLLRRRRNA
jgi:fibronectin-binding autotransporter adhesin